MSLRYLHGHVIIEKTTITHSARIYNVLCKMITDSVNTNDVKTCFLPQENQVLITWRWGILSGILSPSWSLSSRVLLQPPSKCIHGFENTYCSILNICLANLLRIDFHIMHIIVKILFCFICIRFYWIKQ